MDEKRTVVVTGGSNGIGLSIVKAYATGLNRVYMLDVDEKTGSFQEKALREMGLEVTFLSCNVGDPYEVEKAFASIMEREERIDVLINNAGKSTFKSIWDVTYEEWNDILASNLSSVFYCSREAARHMHGGGTIVNLSSTRAHMSEANTEAYSASKGGIYALTHSLAVTLSEKNITVNSISPGWIETKEYENLREIDHKQHLSNRVGKPEDIARACLFLTNPDNTFINGENLVVDGGMTRKMIYEH